MSTVNEKMTALADAVRAKSGVSGKLTIDAMTTAVNDITINPGGDIDLSGVTVTADKLLAGIVAVDGSGAYVSVVNGRMPAIGGEIIVINDIPNNNIVMGYFDLYALLEKKGITIDTSEHVKFLEDQTVVRGRGRYDGKPVIAKAFVAIGIGSAPTTEVDFPGQDES